MTATANGISSEFRATVERLGQNNIAVLQVSPAGWLQADRIGRVLLSLNGEGQYKHVQVLSCDRDGQTARISIVDSSALLRRGSFVTLSVEQKSNPSHVGGPQNSVA